MTADHLRALVDEVGHTDECRQYVARDVPVWCSCGALSRRDELDDLSPLLASLLADAMTYIESCRTEATQRDLLERFAALGEAG